jgi:hypothetical protein
MSHTDDTIARVEAIMREIDENHAELWGLLERSREINLLETKTFIDRLTVKRNEEHIDALMARREALTQELAKLSLQIHGHRDAGDDLAGR